ncbi:fungal-specific transcription factor domain-containing protein [Colletotrichum acutatum]|uniref:Fungal-specific transcription factor domain-containing protein n=1 Tax=Glomerella acutata TaxID=27357 RepID=A0AAD8XFQ1_GLOAC|nr:fungal-specific transcription factor domain-containing protein [Colletotrichum acutatum]KAK1723058.1 fungal-specific transcription factor domain-containing protein [Colletotrichum acutatum]
MTLGPQCWRCRKKRLRCDSSVPACRKCIIAHTECPGYGEKRPIAFRDPLVLTQKGVVVRTRSSSTTGSTSPPASVLGIVCRSPRTAGSVMELRIAADAMEYYNHHVAPDLVPYSTSTSPYQISPNQIASLASYLRNTYISIAALHRHISGQPSSSSSSILSRLSTNNKTLATSAFRSSIRPNASAPGDRSELSRLMAAGDFKSVHFASQAAALQALGQELCAYHQPHRNDSTNNTEDPGPSILLGIMVMLTSQIQFSAYAPWQSHITGAWSIILTHGPFAAVAKSDPELCRLLQQFAIFDIFGTSTHGAINKTITTSSSNFSLPSVHVVSTILARQESYEAIFQEDSDTNARNPWRLVPNDLATILIRINGLRARRALYPETAKHLPESLAAVLDYLDTSPPEKWAAEISATAQVSLAPSRLSEDQETKDAWVALMTTYHSAAALYAINSLAGLGTAPRSSTVWSEQVLSHLARRESAAYSTLVASLRVLFTQRIQRQPSQANNNNNNNTPSSSIAISAGLLHKFVIWPMVIGGIQSALIYHDQEITNFMCSGMQAVGEELGTVSMIDGARLVEKLQREAKHGRKFSSWDELFEGAPLFLM